MATNFDAISLVTRLVGAREAADLIQLSKVQDRLEEHWRRKARAAIAAATAEILENAAETGRLRTELADFLPLFMEHSHAVMRAGLESAAKRRPAVRAERLAAPPKAAVPRSLKALREWWDAWRKQGKAPKRQRAMAERLKAEYLRRLQAAWVKYGASYRAGETASTSEAVRGIMREADVSYSRVEAIVDTETTYYFNKARRTAYDQSPDVTHYLFVAIRDFATTKWCKSRQGLVYAKGDPLLDNETPPIHWRCRSEMLPLTPQNPAHLALIKDRSRMRRHHRPEPLPAGWTAR